jgi:hypothetical protein
MGTVAQNLSDILHFQNVDKPLLLVKQILDRDHDGILSLSEVASKLNGGALDAATKEAVNSLIEKENKTGQYVWRPGLDIDKDGAVNIDKELRPLLVNAFKSLAPFPTGKCTSLEPCRTWVKSVFALQPNLSVIGNLSSTNILILNGEKDSQTPVQQAFLLQQRLTELNHPDHTLITYPSLGHAFYPSSQWSTALGPIQQYILADLYAWLEAHSGLSHTVTYSASHKASNMTFNS